MKVSHPRISLRNLRAKIRQAYKTLWFFVVQVSVVSLVLNNMLPASDTEMANTCNSILRVCMQYDIICDCITPPLFSTCSGIVSSSVTPAAHMYIFHRKRMVRLVPTSKDTISLFRLLPKSERSGQLQLLRIQGTPVAHLVTRRLAHSECQYYQAAALQSCGYRCYVVTLVVQSQEQQWTQWWRVRGWMVRGWTVWGTHLQYFHGCAHRCGYGGTTTVLVRGQREQLLVLYYVCSSSSLDPHIAVHLDTCTTDRSLTECQLTVGH